MKASELRPLKKISSHRGTHENPENQEFQFRRANSSIFITTIKNSEKNFLPKCRTVLTFQKTCDRHKQQIRLF
jgi:hypothetical protein